MGSNETRRRKRGPATPIVVQYSPVQKNWEFELRKEVASLKETIQSLTQNLEQKSAQNEEIIQHYYKQYKELEQSRQELKLLQHEYTQMSSVYRICKMELESKLQEANERISQLLEEKDKKVMRRTAAGQAPRKKAEAVAAGSVSGTVGTLSPGKENVAAAAGAVGTLSPVKENVAAAAVGTLSPVEENVGAGAVGTLSPVKENIAAVEAPAGVKKAEAGAAASKKKGRPAAAVAKEAAPSAETEAREAAPPAETEAQEAAPSRERPTSSSGRPARRAAAVSSYKEPPLNTKMRRSS